MSRKASRLLCALFAALLVGPPSLSAAAFTPGNLVIYRVGNGSGSLVNTGNPVFLDEYTPAGALVQSIPLPTTVNGMNQQLIASGTATSEGLLTRSADFRYLILTGYARDLGGVGSLSGTASATVKRTVGRVDNAGAIDTSTALSDFADGNNPRGATSGNGTSLWVAGGAGGIRFTTLGAGTSTQLSTTVTNLRQPSIFNGQLYVSTGSGSTVRVGTVGSGTPTTSGQTIANLPGFPTGGSPYSYFLADLSAAVPGPDTLYVADDGAGLQKFSLVSGSWIANGTAGAAADAYRGLAATVSGSTVTLYATRKGGSGATGGGELVSLTDASGYNGAFAGSPTLLATAALNTAFRGIALAPEPGPALAAQNVVVYRVGDGTAGLINTGSPVFLDEIRPDGVVVRSTPLPTTASGAQKQLIASGTATSEGLLTLSADGRYLVLTGYARNLGGSGSLAGTASTTVNRTVGRVDASGTVDTSTALSDFADGNNPRSATSSDGTNLWVAGGAGGIRFATLGATTSTQLSTTVTNLRQPSIFNGQLYVSTGSGSTVRVGTVGSGTPTTSGQTIVNLPGFPTSGSPNAYVFADLSPTVPGLDTLYVADDGIGLQKFSLVSGSWVSNGTVGAAADAYRGVTAQVTGSTVTLYATRKGGGGATGGGELVVLADASGYDGAFAGTPTLIATAANNVAYRGVALMPVCAMAELAVTRAAPASGSLGVPFDYTLTVSNLGSAAASAVTVQFTLPANVSYNSATGISGFSPAFAAGVVTFSGGMLPAGTSVQLTVRVTPTSGGTVASSAGDVIVDPGNAVSECNETANTTLTSASTVIGVPNTPPAIQAAATTTPYLAAPPAGPATVSGVLSDPTDPAATLGIDFTIGDAETAVASLTVTVASNNQAVVPDANLTLTGSGASRNLKILPMGVGYATINVMVSDGTAQTSYVIQYAASAASADPATTRFLTGASDASTALAVDADTMLVGDDENQVLRLYRRDHSGLPVAGFDFTASLGLTDISGAVPREVDIEASTRLGNRLFWLGSHDNNSDGNPRPNRNRLFATDLSGSGATATLAYVGRYDGLKTDLIAWDNGNGHGLGASHYGLAASAAAGVLPESPAGDGFNIEGLSIAPDGATAFVGFRAPLVPPGNRTRALLVPVTNLSALVTGNPSAGPATFGAPIELDLGGRGIRSIECNASGCLILAGPPAGATGIPPADFRIYTWSGNPTDAPSLRTTDLTTLAADGSFEGIVEVPSPLTESSPIQLVVDNGDTVYYGDGVISKDQLANWQKSRSEIVTAPASADLSVTKTDGVTSATAGGSMTYTITASNAGPSNATGATVADTLPASLTCTWTCVGAGGGTCMASGSGNINDTVNLPSGGSVTYTASCTISAAAAGSLSNTAAVTAPAGVTDPTPGNNSATDIDALGASADLSITQTDGVTSVTAGSSVTYTITASNAGPSNATGAAVVDTLPASLTCTWTCVGAGSGTCTASGSGNINDTVNLPSGGSVTYTASCMISAAATGSLSNTATVTAPAGVTDPTPGNNSATDSNTVNAPPAPVISTIKTVSGSFQPGGAVTYTIVLQNSGPGDQRDNPGDELTDVLPSSLTLVSAAATSGTAAATVATNSVTWNGVISAGGSVTVTIQATIKAGTPAGTTISNQANFSYDADGNGTNEMNGVSDDPGAGGAADPTAITVVGAPPAAPIPTLDGIGLALLILLMASVGAVALRRRRV
jgi:uncharacterized repeat protein (TIGR01451 family)